MRAVLSYMMDRESMRDITPDLEGLVEGREGILHLFAKGSTASLTLIEYEPNLVKDFFKAMERIAPSDEEYEHHRTWGDDNGRSHVRASVVGFSLSIPVVEGRLWLGTWQQVVLINFDTRPRRREVMAWLCQPSNP